MKRLKVRLVPTAARRSFCANLEEPRFSADPCFSQISLRPTRRRCLSAGNLIGRCPLRSQPAPVRQTKIPSAAPEFSTSLASYSNADGTALAQVGIFRRPQRRWQCRPLRAGKSRGFNGSRWPLAIRGQTAQAALYGRARRQHASN
jgi:hypothetical protein